MKNIFNSAPMVTTDNFMGRTKERFKFRKGPYIKIGARIGANSLLLPGKVIGREAFVAAGSIVTKDVPDYKLVMGAPAKVIRSVPSKEWAENPWTIERGLMKIIKESFNILDGKKKQGMIFDFKYIIFPLQ